MAFFNFFKSKPNQEPGSEYYPQIQAALETFGTTNDLDWEGVIDAIAARIGDDTLANDLFRFMPIVYARLILPDVGLADHFRQQTKDGGYTEHKFADIRLYVQVASFLDGYLFSKEESAGLLRFNSEIDAINQALHNGSQLEDLVVSPPLFT